MPCEKCFFQLAIIVSSALFHVQEILTAHLPEGQFVMNGEHIKIETMPHSVFVLITFEWPSDVTFCSGSLLSHRWVLTSAHCFRRVSKSTGLVKLRLGMDTFSQEGPMSDVKMVKCHDRFYWKEWSYDVCLLQTFDEIPFSEHVQPAALPFANETVQSLVKVRAAGWGDTASLYAHEPPFLLSAVDLDIVDYDECNRQYGNLREDRRTYFCAGNLGRGFEMKSLCYGDSGSSAVVRRHNRTWVAMGVTCLVNDCEGAVFFVSVPFHVNWIRSTMTRYS